MDKLYLNNLKKYWKTVVLIVVIAVVLGFVFSIVQPLKYSATIELLIIQKQEQISDAYTAAKSVEKLSTNLAQVVYTNSFFDKVMSSGFAIEDKFSKDEIKKRKEWQKMISTEVAWETGMLKVVVYDTDKNQASQIAEAIAYVLATKGDEYHGAGKNVIIKTVDSVLLSRYPVKPNIPVNLLIALALGLLAGNGFVILKSKSGEEAIGNKKAEAIIPIAPTMANLIKEEKKEIENKEIEKIEVKENRFVRMAKPADGIWTMRDFVESEVSPDNKYFYEGEKLELAPEIAA